MSLYSLTLLRVTPRTSDERPLLAYAINYAEHDETNGSPSRSTAVRRLSWNVLVCMPYYLKVREYNDMENRDVWEYELDLSHDTIDRVLMHVWELGPIYFDYYFFDENCSYYLLELWKLRARSRSHQRIPLVAIPSDTSAKVVSRRVS